MAMLKPKEWLKDQVLQLELANFTLTSKNIEVKLRLQKKRGENNDPSSKSKTLSQPNNEEGS